MKALDIFKTAIKLTSKNTTETAGLNIIVDWDEPGTEKRNPWSYVDWNYEKDNPNVYKIYIAEIGRSYKELLFDYYHNIGMILYRKGQLKKDNAVKYVKGMTEFYSDELIERMTCDEYAIKEMGYKGAVNKLIPKVSLDDLIKINKGIKPFREIRIIDQRVINNHVTIRRKFVDHIITNVSAVISKPESKRSKGNAEWFALGDNNNSKKILSPMRKKEIMNGLADYIGYVGDDKKKKKKSSSDITSITSIIKSMNIDVYDTDTFDTCINKLISAIKEPFMSKGKFNIPEFKFVHVTNEPVDWENKYKKYWKFDYSNIGKKNSVPQYIPLTETIIKNPNDESQEIKCTPAFDDNVYRRTRVNKKKEIDNIVSKYSKLVEEFVIPTYKKYNSVIHKNERDLYMTEIKEVLLMHKNDGSLPTPMELERIRSRLSDPDAHMTKVKASIINGGFMSYNEKKNIVKNKNPKYVYETDSEYNARIDMLIREMDEANRKEMMNKNH